MQAMVLEKQGQKLQLKDVPKPSPGDNQVLIKVNVCGICRTDLHVVDGDLTEPNLPIIPGHQIVGHVVAFGKSVTSVKIDDRIGVPWLGGELREMSFLYN